ncbi:MAG: hypothetical protein ACLS36_01150 [Streptococcus sp.]
MPLPKVVLAHRHKLNKFNSLKPDELKNGNYKSAVGHGSLQMEDHTITSDGG